MVPKVIGGEENMQHHHTANSFAGEPVQTTPSLVSEHSAMKKELSKRTLSHTWSSFKKSFAKKGSLNLHHLEDVDEIPSQHVEQEEKAAQDVVPPVPFRKLFSMATREDWFFIAVGSIGAMGQGTLFPLFAIFFGDFTNAFGDDGNGELMGAASSIALNFTYVAIAALVSGIMMTTFFMMSGNRQANRMRQKYLACVLGQEIAFFDVHATTGSLLQGLNEDSLAVQKAISEKLGSFIHHMTTFVVGYIIAFSIGWDMTLVMVACLPLLAAVGFLMAKVAAMADSVNSKGYANASSLAQQSITQIRTIAAYNRAEVTRDEYCDALEAPRKAGVKSSFIGGMGIGGVQLILMSSYAVSLYYGAIRIADGAYDGGQVLSIQFATLLGGFSLGQAAPLISVFAAGTAAGARMFKVMESKPGIVIEDEEEAAVGKSITGHADSGSISSHSTDDNRHGKLAVTIAPGHAVGTLANLEGSVELRNVVFSYPSRPDVPIFRNFNLVVPAGKTVALVGSSGSGKSTVVQLLERFYDPSGGLVLLDGVDIRTLSLSWLRHQIGLVSQEPTLFATTIYENIAIGKDGCSVQEVEDAAMSANAHKFITALPDGYQTKVGERGCQLSGGQKQRIAIARAILKNPKIMLLDEATSALDNNSERLVQQALDHMIVGRTTVVVAHRLSTIQHADVISVVQNGSVVEQGNHNELVKDTGGVYFMLVQMQLQRQKEEERVVSMAPVEEVDDVVDSEIESFKKTVKQSMDASRASTDRPKRGVMQILRVSQDRGASPPTSKGVVSNGDNSRKSGDGQMIRASSDGNHFVDQDGTEEKAAVVPVANVGFMRLVQMNRPEWGWGALGLVGSFMAGVQQPAFAFVITSMISLFYTDDMDDLKSDASFYSWMFFVIGFGSFLGLWMQQLSLGIMGANLAKRVRVALFGSIMKQEIGWFDRDENSSGCLTSALCTDATYIRGAVGDTLGMIVMNLTTLALGYTIAFIYDWRMALLVTGILPLLVVSQIVHMKYVMGNVSESDGVYTEANRTVTEAFSSIRIIQAYNLQKFINKMYKGMLDDCDKMMVKGAWFGGFAFGGSMSVMFGMYGLVIYFGAWEIDAGLTTFDDMLKAYIAILLAAIGLGQASMCFPDVGKAKGAVQRVFPIIDRQSLIDCTGADGITPPAAEVKGAITFENIRFAYPNRPKVIVFRDFNLHIDAGKMCALVGESGSGKSTVVGLLERFYDPLQGRVLMDGIDIKEYNIRHLRSLIGLVSQEPLLFSGSVADNIRVGKPDASQEEIEVAAAAANATEFIAKLPELYNTKVGEGGVQLSGGQKQRVAIARAYIKNPKILLLDEATSALDARSEKVVQEALDKLMVGRTSLVIAHRLSTIRDADCICVVYRGIILEQGTHDELMAIPSGSYARMVPTQGKGAA